MDILTQIFEVIAEVIAKFGLCIKNVFDSVIGLFYTAPGTGETTGHMTVLGVLGLIGVGSGLVWFAFRLIKRLCTRV